MFDPRRKIEEFCYRHPGFGIPNLMRYLTIANVVFWLMGLVNGVFLNYMVFDPALILHGQIWRLVSFLFIPPSMGFLALLVFYCYYWIGSVLEQQWGTGPFTVFFFSGAVLSVLCAFLVYFVTGRPVYLDSAYLYLSMFFAFAILFPDMQMLFMFIIPIKVKYLGLIDAAFFLYQIVTTRFPQNLVPVVAMLNVLIFCGSDLKRLLPRKQSRSTINFKRESARIRREQQHKLYTHKCAVCGKTDVDYPDLEFRYCSRCQGYHCFCSEHINNHIHFTE